MITAMVTEEKDILR